MRGYIAAFPKQSCTAPTEVAGAVRYNARMKSLLCLILACSVFAALARATGAQSIGDGRQQFADLGDFRLRSGDVIKDFRLGYRTLGQLNPSKSNAILWPTWLGGKTENLLQFVGPGKVVNTADYFIILVDAIGNGVSTSPSNSQKQPLLKFPVFTIRDMVESEHRLLAETFHLTHLRAVMGISMGGMQTFEWIVAYPDFMDLAVPMFGSPQSTSWDKLLWTAQIDAIQLDPAWNNGNPTGPLSRGFAVSEEIGQMNLTSPAYRVAHTTAQNFDPFLADIKNGAAGDGGLACDQIRQRQAIISLDLPGEFGLPGLNEAAKKVHAKTFVIVSPQDHLVNPIPAEQFAAALSAPMLTLDSPCGHISLDCISAGPIVAKFLADPASARSETLRDTANH
jgi:pimeloyl-ACP methyl ester carboxylesterase